MPSPPAAGTIVHALGTFTRNLIHLADRTLIDDHYTLERDVDGRLVTLLANATAPEALTRVFARLDHAVRNCRTLSSRAAHEVARAFSEQPPTRRELEDAVADFVVETIEADPDGSVVFHLTDTCGEHVMEGYWPAVRFGPEDDIVEVTVEA